MTEPRKQALATQIAPERPHRLVLHLRQNSPASKALFNAVLRSAAQLEGLREITLDLTESDLRSRNELESVGAATLHQEFDLRATVSAAQVLAWGAGAFSSCRQVDIRMEFERAPTLRAAPDVFLAAESLLGDSRVVNLHVELNRHLIVRLTPARLRSWLDRSDFVTLMVPRKDEPDFTRDDLVVLFDRLAPLWESPDRFFHLQVDRSIKPAFFPWSLLSVTCPAADLALHLDADGRLFLGASRTPFAFIEAPARFKETVEHHLASLPGDACEGLSLEAG